MDDTKITSFYADDHDQLDGFFLKFQELKRKDYPQAKEYFKKFNAGLHRHIAWEEEILFPLFEEKTGTKYGGPTHVMREDHREIKRLLDMLHKKVQRQDPNSDQEEEALWNLLTQHNYKEENILYPAIDQHSSVDERKKIFVSMENLPREKYQTCCCQVHLD